jgi:PAS domain S-box-containing protein
MRADLTTRATLAYLALAVLVVGGFIVLAAEIQGLRHQQRSDATAAATLTASGALENSLLGLQTGARGYVITGQAAFLAPYRQALAAYPRQVGQLERLTMGDPAAHRGAAAIGRAIDGYVRTWTAPVIRQAATSLPAARRMVATGAGRQRVGRIQRQIAALNRQQQALVAARQRTTDRTGTASLVLGLCCAVVSLVLIALFAFSVRKYVAHPVHRLAEGFIRLHRGELATRVPVSGVAEIRELTRGFNTMAASLEAQRDEMEQHSDEMQGQQIELENALDLVAEQKEQAQQRQRFSERLATKRGIEDVAAIFLREIADQADAQVGAVYVLNEQTGALTFRAGRGVRATDFAPTLAPGQGLAGRAVAEQRPVGGGYPETSLRLPGLTGDRAIRHEVHLPLRHRDQVLGVLSLGRSSDLAFTAGQIDGLAELTLSAALACAEALGLRRLEVVAAELQSVMDSTDEGIYRQDPGGRITFINRSALAQTGYTAAELLGQDAHQMFHHSRLDGSPYPAAECPMTTATPGGPGTRFQGEVFWRKDGTPFPVDCSAAAVLDGGEVTSLVVTFRDVSEARLAEQQRAVQYQAARVLAGAGRVRDALPRLLGLLCDPLGWQLSLVWQPADDGAADSTVLRCVAAQARPGHADELALASHDTVAPGQGTVGQAWQSRQPAVPPDGQPRAELAVPIVRDGAVAAVVQLIGNQNPQLAGLTETIETVAAQFAQFAERKQSEAAASRIKDQFVATVSHELRTPLAAMDGWLHILLDEDPGPLNDEQRTFLGTVKRNSDRLMRLVGDLLLIGQMDAGRFTLELGDVDLAELVTETVALFGGPAAEKKIELTAAVPPAAPLHGDRLRLGQLLSNLVSNAVKFTPEGGQVRVSLTEHAGMCRVTVADSGVGIPPAERGRLFERFYRASTASGTAGSGLGLAISKAIAEAHGGSLRIVDSAGPGTTVLLAVPVAVPVTGPVTGPAGARL